MLNEVMSLTAGDLNRMPHLVFFQSCFDFTFFAGFLVFLQYGNSGGPLVNLVRKQQMSGRAHLVCRQWFYPYECLVWSSGHHRHEGSS